MFSWQSDLPGQEGGEGAGPSNGIREAEISEGSLFAAYPYYTLGHYYTGMVLDR